MNSYPGGKGGAGTYQKIINQMPPHEVYIEAFLGGGAVMRAKRPAPSWNIGIDLDAGALAAFADAVPTGDTVLVEGDALQYLASNTFSPETLIYLDPPYLMETRSSKRKLYVHEMTVLEHERLLRIIQSLPCMVMISGYWSDLYGQRLQDWRYCRYSSQTRGGRPATEYLWMNYPEPLELHDYRYLGDNYRERERITRKKKRWVNKLSKMPVLERYALLAALEGYRIAGDGGISGGIAGSGGLGPKNLPASPASNMQGQASPAMALQACTALPSGADREVVGPKRSEECRK